MYTVQVDGHLLYHPTLIQSGYAIYNPVITYETNKSGSFQFSMPITNVLYNQIKKMSSIITVYDNSEEIFRGRVLSDERDFNNNKLVYCEGELAYLLDSIIRPTTFSGTVAELFAYIITAHNAEVDSYKRFSVGECTVLPENEVSIQLQDYSSAWSVLNSYLLDVYGGYIRTRVSDDVRYIDYISSYNSTNDQVIQFGTNLLDIDQFISAESIITKLIPLGASYAVEVDDSEITPGEISSVETETIKNKAGNTTTEFVFKLDTILNSKSKDNSTSNITINYYGKAATGSVSFAGLSASKIYADIQISEKQKVKTGLNGKTLGSDYILLATWTGNVTTENIAITGEFINRYTNKDTKPISNSMSVVVNLLQQKYVYYNISGEEGQSGRDYLLADQSIIDQFGLIEQTKIWSDVTDTAELLQLGQEYLSNNTEMSVRLDINAMDLHLLNVSYEKFKIGDQIHVISTPHALDTYFVCNKMSINLQSPENNTYSLGKEYKTLTEQHISTANSIVVTTEQIANVVNDLDATQSKTEAVNALVETIYDKYADVTTVINNLDTAYAEIDFANIETAAIENLIANSAFITSLNANYAQIDLANVDMANIATAQIEDLFTNTAMISELSSRYAAIDFANIQTAAITNLMANSAFVNSLDAAYANIDLANVDMANITSAKIAALFTNSAFISQLESRYADIDFATITEAAIRKVFAATGIVTNMTVSENLQVTGELSVLTINGDLINANTLKANRLLIEGEDGLYYELNLKSYNDGNIDEEEWIRIESDVEDALHGTNIIAESITADRIAAGSITTEQLTSTMATDLGITALETNYNGISGRVASLENSITDPDTGYAKRIANLELTADGFNTFVSETYANDLQDLKDADNTMSRDISNNYTEYKQTASTVTTTASTVARINGEVTTLSTSFVVDADGAYIYQNKETDPDDYMKLTSGEAAIYVEGEKSATFSKDGTSTSKIDVDGTWHMDSVNNGNTFILYYKG